MKNKKKQIIITLIAIISLIVITVGVTYAFFNYAKEGTTDNTIKTGSITFLYTEVSGVGKGISLTDAYPVADSIGKVQVGEGKVFDFKVTSNISMNSNIGYQVTARKKTGSTLANSAVKVYLTEVNGTEQELLLSKYSELSQTDKVDISKYDERILYEATVPANTSNYEKNFRLRMWVSDDTDFSDGSMNDKTFTLTVNVYADGKVVTADNTYKEALLNGTDPVITDNLIPVVISNTGVVTKADTSKEWYSYEKKNWANSVILKDESVVYKNGEEIPESNVESYFVWIPKYSYQLFDLGNYSSLTSISDKTQEIKIKFGTSNTSDSVSGECTTPMKDNQGIAGTSGNCKVGDYMTHPAFLAFDTTGLWVGKFETGYDGATSTATAQVNSFNTSKIVIKPNVYSWRNITVRNMFKNSYNYQRNLDSHMMKNTEWGSVAYLQHSKYGSQASVRINNNSSYITGYAATVEPTLGYAGGTSTAGNRVESTSLGKDGTYTVNYLNTNSTVASTTNNYSGIYDMSGGAWEYVTGYTTGATTVGGSSGITGLYPNFFSDSVYSKYWDKYTAAVNTNYNNRILGDAIGEMGPFGSEKDPDGTANAKSSWYKDYAYFADSVHPWFVRGGRWCYGAAAGAFAFSYGTGATSTSLSFRIVLAPTK